MILIEHHVMVKVNNTSRFFRDKIEIFSNLVVRDEIEICFFYISCFETRSRICFTTSRISRRGRETKQLILEVEREFSMLILARHFEIENSRQCLRDRDAVIIIIRENLMGSEAEWAMGKKTTKAAVNSTRNLDI